MKKECLIFILIIFIGLTSASSISEFLGNMTNNYELIISDNASADEIVLIAKFAAEFNLSSKTSLESEYSGNEKRIIVISNYDKIQTLNYSTSIFNNNSIVIYDSQADSLYVYSKNLESLNITVEMLLNYEKYSNEFSKEEFYLTTLQETAQETATSPGGGGGGGSGTTEIQNPLEQISIKSISERGNKTDPEETATQIKIEKSTPPVLYPLIGIVSVVIILLILKYKILKKRKHKR